MNPSDVKDIDAYISAFPDTVQVILKSVRNAIREAAPDAHETISYKMPAFSQNGILVYFAAFKNHIGLFALPSGNAAFRKELLNYKTGKGSIQFPLNEPMPLDLIQEIVRFRVIENESKPKRR